MKGSNRTVKVRFNDNRCKGTNHSSCSIRLHAGITPFWQSFRVMSSSVPVKQCQNAAPKITANAIEANVLRIASSVLIEVIGRRFNKFVLPNYRHPYGLVGNLLLPSCLRSCKRVDRTLLLLRQRRKMFLPSRG